jgi:integrase
MTRNAPNRLRIVAQTVAQTPAPAVERSAPRRPRGKKRADHRGVFIVPPRGPKAPYWRMRFKCPDTGKLRFVRLTGEQARTVDARRDAAVEMWQSLRGRSTELRAGAERLIDADNPVSETFELYFAGRGARKRPLTQGAYRRGVNAFLAWCALPAVSITRCRQVTPGKLRAYASYAAALKLEDGSGVRAATTVNNALARLGAPLVELAAENKFPLTREQVRAALHPLKAATEKKPFYRSPMLRKIADACTRHDAESYDGAHSGRMLPTVLFVLLTGLRANEALRIEWRDVGIDEDGNARISVRREIAKTDRRRSIYLKHSPLLAHLVSDPRGRTGTILGGSTETLGTARERIAERFSVAFDCQALRRTCGTYLTCAPSIFKAAAPYMSATQLGHSVQVAQSNYVGVVSVSSDACTTEDAMSLGKKYDHAWQTCKCETEQCPCKPGFTIANTPTL